MQKLRMFTKLSNKPSELIFQALADLAIVEKRKDLKVCMGTFLAINQNALGSLLGTNNAVCEMCLAGSTMYLGTPQVKGIIKKGDYEYIAPSNYCPTVRAKLEFLSEFQFGNFRAAFKTLGIEKPDFLPDLCGEELPLYHTDRRGYKAQLRKLAKMLARRGL